LAPAISGPDAETPRIATMARNAFTPSVCPYACPVGRARATMSP
jgi:hypothetical protein